MTPPVEFVAESPTDMGNDERLIDLARDLATDVCGPHAVDVDRAARYPHEALNALRDRRLLGAGLPQMYGGGGSLSALVEIAGVLGRACGATAMIWAMHQIQLICLHRHAGESKAVAEMLHRIGVNQLLVASATSEEGTGGNLRVSRAAVHVASAERAGEPVCRLDKKATTVSYGAHADAFLITARRSPDADPGDQVAVLVDRAQVNLEPAGVWNPLGMRGTCSPGFRVFGEFPADQILPVPFHEQAAETMVPASHVLWSAVWLGLAEEALARATGLARRRLATGAAPTDHRLAEAHWRLDAARAQLFRTTELVSSMWSGRQAFGTSTLARLNALKLAASETAVQVTQGALCAAGMAGYSEDGRYSIARIMRDVLSAPLMIGNSRLLSTNASLVLLER